MEAGDKRCVLFVYESYPEQSLNVVEARGNVLRDRGCDVELAGNEFLDPRQPIGSAFPRCDTPCVRSSASSRSAPPAPAKSASAPPTRGGTTTSVLAERVRAIA